MDVEKLERALKEIKGHEQGKRRLSTTVIEDGKVVRHTPAMQLVVDNTKAAPASQE